MNWLNKLHGKEPDDERGDDAAETLRKFGGAGHDTVLRQPPEPVTPGATLSPKAQTSLFSSAPLGRFAAGDRIADTYEIRRLLGEGAMGVVYLAQQAQWDEDV